MPQNQRIYLAGVMTENGRQQPDSSSQEQRVEEGRSESNLNAGISAARKFTLLETIKVAPGLSMEDIIDLYKNHAFIIIRCYYCLL